MRHTAHLSKLSGYVRCRQSETGAPGALSLVTHEVTKILQLIKSHTKGSVQTARFIIGRNYLSFKTSNTQGPLRDKTIQPWKEGNARHNIHTEQTKKREEEHSNSQPASQPVKPSLPCVAISISEQTLPYRGTAFEGLHSRDCSAPHRFAFGVDTMAKTLAAFCRGTPWAFFHCCPEDVPAQISIHDLSSSFPREETD